MFDDVQVTLCWYFFRYLIELAFNIPGHEFLHSAMYYRYWPFHWLELPWSDIEVLLLSAHPSGKSCVSMHDDMHSSSASLCFFTQTIEGRSVLSELHRIWLGAPLMSPNSNGAVYICNYKYNYRLRLAMCNCFSFHFFSAIDFVLFSNYDAGCCWSTPEWSYCFLNRLRALHWRTHRCVVISFHNITGAYLSELVLVYPRWYSFTWCGTHLHNVRPEMVLLYLRWHSFTWYHRRI